MKKENIRHVIKFRPKLKEKDRELRGKFPAHADSVELRKKVRKLLQECDEQYGEHLAYRDTDSEGEDEHLGSDEEGEGDEEEN